MRKIMNQMCYHEKTKTFFRITKHGYYLTHVQKIVDVWEDTKILPVYAMLFTKELTIYPWVVGDK